ncbi:MAG: DNA primase, partial [Nocardioides sp.]
AVAEQAAPPRPPVPDLRDPRFAIERATLRVLIQHPVAVGRLTADITATDFQHPAYQAVWGLIAAAGGPGAGAGDKAWATKLAGAATTPQLTSLVSALAVEPLTSHREPDAGYVTEHVIRLREASLQRRISDVHSRLQRTSPAEDPAGYQALFGELATLEQQRRSLRERLIG